jgi:signal transduction histidine kinase
MAIVTLMGCFLLLYTIRLEFKSQIKNFFLLLAISSITWCLGYTLSISVTDLQLKKYFTLVEYLGIASVGPIFLLFIIAYTRDLSLKSNPITYLIFVPSIFHYATLFTNEINGGLFYEYVGLIQELPFYRLDLVYGPTFYSHTFYNYFLILAGLILLIQTYITSAKGDLYRKQVFLIILGVLIPVFANIIRVFKLIPSLQFIDPTPISFLFSFIVFYYSLYRYGLLILVPIALERVFEGINDGIIVLDKNFRVMNINNASLQFFLVSKDEKIIFGENFFLMIKQLENLHGFSIDLLNLENEMALLYQNPSKSYSTNFKLKIDDKILKTINISSTAILQSNREIIGFILVLTDITERKKAEDNIDFLHSLLKHDISNKIQVIGGYLSLLDKSNLGEKERNFINKSILVAEEGMALVHKIDRLRELDRVDLYRLQKSELVLVLNHTIQLYTSRVAELGAEIKFIHDKRSYDIMGGELLKEMFSNLIENFLNHSQGKVLKFTLKDSNDEVELIVEDDGVGIEPEMREMLFKRGYKGSGSRGSGLGLYLIKKTIETYKGTITVDESTLGGMKFIVNFKKFL